MKRLFQKLKQIFLPSKPIERQKIMCTGNDGNGCFLDSCGHNCGCVGIQPLTHTTETTLQQPDVMRSVLADLQSQLESSRQLSPPLDYSEGQWREGMEYGLETAIQILEDALTKHFS